MQLVINNGRAKGRSITVTGPRFLIGREPECQLRPLSDEVSRRHAELKVVGGVAVIVDLGSEAGTRVNGQRLTGAAAVRNGDRVEIGPLCFTILMDGARKRAKPRRVTEDEVASWLIDEDEDDDEAASSWERQAPESGERSTAPTKPGFSRPYPAGPPSESVDNAFELLRAMSIRRE